MENFWNKYIEADLLERQEMLKPILKNFKDIHKLPEEHQDLVLTNLLTSYFDDLIMVMEQRNE